MMVRPSDDNISHHINHKISLAYDNPQSKKILRLVNDISIVRIFASVTEPMTASDICEKPMYQRLPYTERYVH